MRHVVLVTRHDWIEADLDLDHVAVGPFRTRERAEDRARVIRNLAETYEDPEGVTGSDNAISVVVQPLLPGATSVEDVLAVLYGSVVLDD